MIGLLLIALGTGGIKPCVSAFGGDQFGPHQVSNSCFKNIGFGDCYQGCNQEFQMAKVGRKCLGSIGVVLIILSEVSQCDFGK